MRDILQRNAKRIAIEGTGWILVALGVLALVLPGPGLLMVFAGLALLATQYQWAEKRVEPIRKAALKTAADSVTSWPRIFVSTLFCLALIGVGIVWGAHPAAPSWWPLADRLWLFGGWGTGVTIIVSGLLAIGMIAYSFRNFRPQSKHKLH